MQFVSCHNGKLHADKISAWAGPTTRTFSTGLAPLDNVLANGVFARGSVHELLTLPTHPLPFFVSLFLARASAIQKEMRPRMHADTQKNTEHRSDSPLSLYSETGPRV